MKSEKIEEIKDARGLEPNVVLIGNKKPTMSYVMAAMNQFSNGNKTVKLKARGQAISKAVDVAQIIKNKFMKEVKVGSITTKTELLKDEESGRESNVSCIEIILTA